VSLVGVSASISHQRPHRWFGNGVGETPKQDDEIAGVDWSLMEAEGQPTFEKRVEGERIY
jgi:hypothetical protein